MSASRKLVIGLVSLAMAFFSFDVGMTKFLERSQAIQNRKAESGKDNVYLSEVSRATTPAKVGTGVALVFLFTGIFFVISAAATRARSNQQP